MTYASSQDAMDAAEPISIDEAKRELHKHGCRILDTCGNAAILVTNDLDAPEWVGCNTRDILVWLGY